jgi:hypothetical protein
VYRELVLLPGFADHPTTNPKPRPALSASPGAGRASIIFIVVASLPLVEHLNSVVFQHLNSLHVLLEMF